MKIIILIVLLSLSLSVQSSTKSSGDSIKASDFNSSVFNLVDIKQSIISQTQFQQLNGDCWVAMTGQDISGSDLANLTGIISLPNAQGRFLRTIGGDAAPLRGTQEDSFKSHDHGVYTAANSNQSYGLASQSGYNQIGNVGHTGAQDTLSRTDFQGSNETRPKNLSVNNFVKINKNCNFN